MKRFFCLIALTVLIVSMVFCINSCSPSEKCDHSQKKTVKENIVESTCIEKGKYEEVEYCTECEAELSRKTVNEQNFAEHKMFNRKCTVCGYEYKECAHTEKETVKENIVENSCVEKGHYDEVQKCKSCQKEISRKTVYSSDPGRHNIVEGECSACGAKDSTAGLKFSANGKFTYSLVDIGDCLEEEIVIDTYNGYPVTKIVNLSFANEVKRVVIGDSVQEIGKYAFDGCYNLESVIIGDGVHTINEYAFTNCSSLSELTVGMRVSTIGMGAFFECPNLERVYIENLSSWSNIVFDVLFANPLEQASDLYLNGEPIRELVIPENVTYVQKYAFSSDSITSVIIPGSVNAIYENAFANCKNLKKVTIENGTVRIASNAFSNCTALEEIIIPDSVLDIGNAFIGCTSLKKIEVAENNSVYRSINGSLYSADGKKLIKYAIGKAETAFTIPDGVESIESYAFSNCEKLTDLTIPESVKDIGYAAFAGSSILRVEFENAQNWQVFSNPNATEGESVHLTDKSQNAIYLKETYAQKYWKKIAD